NATTGQTFGRVIKSPVVSSIMANSRNLIRLEDVTNKLMNPADTSLNQPQLSNTVWPVSGKLVQGFGWYQPADSNKPQFFKGIAIAGLPGAKVVAIHSGKVVEVYQESGLGWTLTLENSGGYRSIYRNLGQVSVNISQNVQAGDIIAQLKTTPESSGTVGQFELYEAGQPIDPLSVLPRN
ncbi:MAG TPA: M23 family metallopeptidase, partial [Bacillota bacterium]|nr:M23 family metallopeptidase [Bacillota bacterium]